MPEQVISEHKLSLGITPFSKQAGPSDRCTLDGLGHQGHSLSLLWAAGLSTVHRGRGKSSHAGHRHERVHPPCLSH